MNFDNITEQFIELPYEKKKEFLRRLGETNQLPIARTVIRCWRKQIDEVVDYMEQIAEKASSGCGRY